MITLPTEVTKVQSFNPRRLVIFAHTKVGKTEALSKLPNNLILDLEEGAEYVEAMKIDIKKILRDNSTNPMAVFQSIGDELLKYYREHGKWQYDYLTVDTTSALEDYAKVFATILYKQTPMGKSFPGTDVIGELPNGGGYLWLRTAFEKLLEPLVGKCNKCFILCSHTKDASINKQGKDLSAKDLALTGKIKQTVCADADAIGFMYRNPQNINQTILSFKTHEQDLATGARPPHLSNQEFVILELTNPDYAVKSEPKIFKDNWKQIFN